MAPYRSGNVVIGEQSQQQLMLPLAPLSPNFQSHRESHGPDGMVLCASPRQHMVRSSVQGHVVAPNHTGRLTLCSDPALESGLQTDPMCRIQPEN